jgi:hypothetical protein
MRKSGRISIEHRATGIVSVVMLALALASPIAMPANVASPLRDAWKLAAIFYPEVTAAPDALVFFQTHPISVAALGPADGSGWNYAGPFRLRVQRGTGATAVAPILDATIVSDRDGGLRSFVLGGCELYDAAGLYALSNELTANDAEPEDVERRLRARFAAYPPSRMHDADKAFRGRFLAAREVIGAISIDEVRFGPSPTRDPSDKTVELHWIVTGSRAGNRVLALFEPFHGRLVSLDLF